ncbi:MAG: ABC transporter permease [Geminicoccaceae bacterium]|nr:ABC transporter permease [Geminicoccaceae bacterium]
MYSNSCTHKPCVRRRTRPATPALAVGGTLLALLVVIVLGAPFLTALLGIDAGAIDLFQRLTPPGDGHPLGTDELGRDLLARLLTAGRVSLAVGLLGAVAAGAIGTVIGLVAGHAGGRVDGFLMRLTDVVIALPLLPLLVVFAALDWGKLGLNILMGGELASLWRLLLIVALFGWTTMARLVRAATLSQQAQPFVKAAEALGASPTRILWRHLLPGVSTPVLVAMALTVGQVILAESVLSFLGLGIQPPLASWGGMLTQAQELIYEAPRLAILPGGLIFLTVLACNLLADGLAYAFDPLRPER